MMNSDRVFGLVLAGGKSSRMGADKGSIQFHRKPQREHLAGLLRPFCEQVFISCGRGQQIPQQIPVLRDMFNLDSPLNGILTAFSTFPDVAWLTVPVDMPDIDDRIIDFLLSHRDRGKLASCFYDSDGELPEPLFTLWELRAFATLLEFQRRGGYSPRAFLAAHNVNLLRVPDDRILTNINTTADLENWKARHA